MVHSSSPSDTPAFTIGREPIDHPDARHALEQYVAELDSRFPGGFDATRAAPPRAGDFTPPAGEFLLIRAGGRVAGCGAVRVDSEGRAEIRRMWVAPELRGRGAGRALLSALEEAAIGLGCRVVRLDTAAELREAQRLYASSGYEEIPDYNGNPYAEHWYEKDLRVLPPS